LKRIVGDNNVGDIYVQGQLVAAVIDTGSMVTTMSESCFEQLHRKPTLLPLTHLTLSVIASNGQAIPYKGYVEAIISIPFMTNKELKVPILIVSDSEVNKTEPVIVGTNVIRLCQTGSSTESVPYEWDTAFKSIADDCVGAV